MNHPVNFDVIIIGAGPAGCSCAMHLAGSGLNIAILDKARFPREKVCGDGLSLKTIQLLEHFPGDFIHKFLAFPKKAKSQRAQFISYNEKEALKQPDLPEEEIESGYIIRRNDFDYLLLEHLKGFSNIMVIDDCTVTAVEKDKKSIKVTGSKSTYTGKIAVGAFGVNIKLFNILTGKRLSRRDLYFAYRTYFKNVGGFRWDNAIELYFLKELLPGYIWLFPLDNNTINAGILLTSSNLKKRIKSPDKVFEKFVQNSAELRDRFKDAEMISSFKGAPLPLTKKKRSVSGERFLLTGDSASLVDPFTGEGIYNALRSGEIAANQIRACFEVHDFSAKYLKAFDKALYNELYPDLKASKWVRRLVRHFNLVSLFTKPAYSFQEFLFDLSNANWDEKARKRLTDSFRIF